MSEMLAMAVGGLGVFFYGMQLLTDHLKKLAGPKLRREVASWTRNPLQGMAWGALAGMMTQSTALGTFILVSLLRSGLIRVRGALPIVLGINIGVSTLLYLVAFDVQVAGLFVLGLAGVVLTSERGTGLRDATGTIFAFALLLLGLGMIQNGAAPLADLPETREFLESSRDSYLLSFLVAAALTSIIQSSVVVCALAISMASAGVFGVEQMIMIIYGSNVGGSLSTLLMASKLEGRSMQIALFQAIFNPVAAVILVPLFYLEVGTGVGLLSAALIDPTLPLSPQLANVFLVFNVVGAIALFSVLGPMERLLAYLSPAADGETGSAPRFLHEHALTDPATALDLILREQQRLLALLPRYLAVAREGAVESRLEQLRTTSESLAGTIDEFIERLAVLDLSEATHNAVGVALSRQRWLRSLDETVLELVRAIRAGRPDGAVGGLGDSILEGTDAVLLTVADGFVEGNAQDLAELAPLTADRGELMQRIRADYLSRETGLSSAERLELLTWTNLCERAFWLLGTLVSSLAPRGRSRRG